MTTTPDAIPLNLTDAQARRAKALRFVHTLYPYIYHEEAQKLALWIVTGRTDETVREANKKAIDRELARLREPKPLSPTARLMASGEALRDG